MAVMGIRVASKQVFYTVIENEEYENKSILIPSFMDDFKRFSYIRKNLMVIILENNVTHIALKQVGKKGIPKGPIERQQNETIVLGIMGDRPFKYKQVMSVRQMSYVLKLSPKQMKDYLYGMSDFPNIENWFDLSVPQRESILVAMCMEVKRRGRSR